MLWSNSGSGSKWRTGHKKRTLWFLINYASFTILCQIKIFILAKICLHWRFVVLFDMFGVKNVNIHNKTVMNVMKSYILLFVNLSLITLHFVLAFSQQSIHMMSLNFWYNISLVVSCIVFILYCALFLVPIRYFDQYLHTYEKTTIPINKWAISEDCSNRTRSNIFRYFIFFEVVTVK